MQGKKNLKGVQERDHIWEQSATKMKQQLHFFPLDWPQQPENLLSPASWYDPLLLGPHVCGGDFFLQPHHPVTNPTRSSINFPFSPEFLIVHFFLQNRQMSIFEQLFSSALPSFCVRSSAPLIPVAKATLLSFVFGAFSRLRVRTMYVSWNFVIPITFKQNDLQHR